MSAGALPRLHRAADPSAVAEAVAGFVAGEIRDAALRRGECRLALAGGKTPRAAYERLAAIPDLDWRKVQVFFGDERAVPPGDPASNFRMASEALLSCVPIPEENVHRIEGELSPDAAASRYAAALGDTPLDLVLLGMGEDGHVASLFPAGPELVAREKVLPTRAPVAPERRVSIGFSVIDAARVVVLLVTGAAKADRLAEVLAQLERGEPALPAARVRPASGALHWFVDEAAFAKIASRDGPPLREPKGEDP